MSTLCNILNHAPDLPLLLSAAPRWSPLSGAPQFYSMNRPAQPPMPNSQVGGSLPFRRPSSVTGQPNMSQSQLNGGPHFAQTPGTPDMCEQEETGIYP